MVVSIFSVVGIFMASFWGPLFIAKTVAHDEEGLIPTLSLFAIGLTLACCRLYL